MMATKSEKLTPLTSAEVAWLIKSFQTKEHIAAPLALANIEALLSFFASQNSVEAEHNYVLVAYAPGATVVTAGKLSSQEISEHPNFSYADVPLGIVVAGEVLVIKGGKATKKLTAGDFVGLFETSDWLNTHHKRNIGDWTLVASTDVQIIYFGASALNGQNTTARQLQKYLIELARTDHVPQPITTLPLLDWVASHTTTSRLADYAIVAHTHLLPNNFPFFRHLAHLVGFGRMFVLEKPYSTVQSTYHDLIKSGCEVVQVRMEPGLPYEHAVQKSLEVLWSKVIEEQRRTGFKKLLVVDDGGDLWLSIPWEALPDVTIGGVEQTQRGISRLTNSSHRIPPIVNVASSGTKKLVESVFIGESIVTKLQSIELLDNKRIGVMGMGSIGAAVVESLEKLGHQPLYYDPSYHQAPPGTPQARLSIDSLFNDAELIIGTTGTDSLKGVALERIHGHKILVSASSADVEFATLLKMAPPASSPFSTRSVQVHQDLTINVLNGGYPLNFDRQRDATPSADIVLTRCLMYIGAMQAVNLLESGEHQSHIYALDVKSQKKTLERWIQEKNASENPAPINIEAIDRIVGTTAQPKESPATYVWKD